MNNKLVLFGIVVVAVLAVAAVGAGFAFAQTSAAGARLAPAQTPVAPGTYGPGIPNGMMGGNGRYGTGYGMMGGFAQNGTAWESMNAMHQWMTTSGGMHTFIWDAVAAKLGLTSDQLTAEVNSGKTLAQIAEATGVKRADLVAALEAAHKASLAQAVADGALTQAQADSLLSHMAGRYDWMLDNMNSYGGTGYGSGMMGGYGGTGYGSGMMGGYRRGMMGNWSGAAPAIAPAPKP